jgi:hypothetical protein
MIQKQRTQVETVNFRQSQPTSCSESYIVFSRCLVFSEFVFYFTFLNCRLVMVIYSGCLISRVVSDAGIYCICVSITNISSWLTYGVIFNSRQILVDRG